MAALTQCCFFVACVEADHNRTTTIFDNTAPVRCSHELLLSKIPRDFKCFPRYCYDLRPTSERGRWVNVMVQGETIVRFFVESYIELVAGLNHMCTICSVHYAHCRHYAEPRPHVKWTVYYNQKSIGSTAELAQASCPVYHMLTAEFEFTDPFPPLPSLGNVLAQNGVQLQSSKVYDDEVVLQKSKTYTEILNDPGEFEPYLKLFEDCFTLSYDFKRSKSKTELVLACGTFIRSVTGRSSILFMKDVVEKLLEPLRSAFVTQSDGHWIETLSDIYENYAQCKDTILAKRLKKVFNHLIAHCFYHKLGIEVDRDLFKKMEKEQIRPNLIECATFADACVGLIVFLLKQGRQCMLTGSMQPLYLSGDTCSDWYYRSKKILVEFESICNPKVIGKEVFTILHELKKCIEEGEAIMSFSGENKLTRAMTGKVVLDLKTKQNEYLTSIAASKSRKTPFAIVLFGAPGIGKATIMEYLYIQMSKACGLNTSPEYRHIHMSDSEYFTGFQTWKHTMIFDDAAQHLPSKVQGVDPSIGFFIKAINSVSWCPPQAALEDKGKTPVLVDNVMVTTNVLDLNIPQYYEASYAVMRRFPVHIEPVVKEAYRKNGSADIDYEKAKSVPGSMDDFWDYIIRAPVAMDPEHGKYRGEFKVVCRLSTIGELLTYVRTMCETHHRQQEGMVSKFSALQDLEFCENCGVPKGNCVCPCPECMARPGECTCANPPTPEPLNPFTEPALQMRRVYDGYNSDDDSPAEDPEDTVEFESPTGGDPYIVRFAKDGSIIFPEPAIVGYELKPGRHPRLLTRGDCHRFRESVPKYLSKQGVKYLNFNISRAYAAGMTDKEIWRDFQRCIEVWKKDEAEDEMRGLFDAFYASLPEKDKDEAWYDRVFKFLVYAYLNISIFRWTINKVGSVRLIRRTVMPLLRPFLVRDTNQKYLMTEMGNAIDKRIGKMPEWAKLLLAAVTAAACIAGVYTLFNKFTRPSVRKVEITELPQEVLEQTAPDEQTVEEVAPVEEQTPVAVEQFGIYPKPINEVQKRNPWVTPERTLTSLDFSTRRITEVNQFLHNLSYNVLLFRMKGNDGRPFTSTFRVLALSEKVFVTCNHCIEPAAFYDATVYFGGTKSCDAMKVRLTEQQLERIPGRDIVVIRTKALPCRFKKIINNFPRRSFNMEPNAAIYKVDDDGAMYAHDLTRCWPAKYNYNGANCDAWYGTARVPTECGDSGSPWVAMTSYGPMILGSHTSMLVSGVLCATRIHYEDVQEWVGDVMSEVGTIEVCEPIVQREKSYIDFHHEKYITYHGELDGFRSRPKHHVYETEIAPQVYGKTLGGQLVERRLFPPVMDNWRPQQVSLKEFVTPVSTMDEGGLQQCVDTYFEYCVNKLPAEELTMLHPYPLEVAVNGAPGITFVDSIKKSTSMGYPWRKPKRAFVIPLEDMRFQDGVKFTPEIEARILDRLERLKKGIRIHPVFLATLKDEGVSLKKLLAWKTRVFFCCPADFLILVRMCFMSFCRLVQRNPFVFGVAIGLNPHSTDWDDIYKFLSRFPVTRTVAGDHVFYDKKMQLLLLKMVMHMVVRFYEKFGNLSREELIVYYTIVEDMVNPTVDYFGMLITLMGGEVSGHQLTTLLNCLISIIYIMYVYWVVYKFVHDFFEHIAIIALGDDHVYTVSEERKDFGHGVVQAEMRKLGLDYTMAEKDAASVDFIELKDAPFLKRKFVYNVELQSVVGPIEKNTIFKMMTVNVESKVATKEEQLAQSLCACVAESFFHGREFFDEIVAFIDSLEKSPRLVEQMKKYPWLSYEGYIERFHEASGHKAIEPGLSQKVPTEDSYCERDNVILQSLKRVDLQIVSHARAFPEMSVQTRLELEPQLDDTECTYELQCSPDNKPLASQDKHILNGNYADQIIPDTAETVTDKQQETTMFVNEPAPQVLDITSSFDKVSAHQATTAELKDFLRRPALIYSYRWTENGAAGLKASFYPFYEFFNKTAIKNKLSNYNLMRANLTLRFLVNGSPFYYGKLGAIYRPLARQMTDLSWQSIVPTRLQQITVSQRPHVWLDNQSTSIEELKLPFLYPYPWLPTQTATNFQDLGQIELWQFAQLRSANGVTTSGIDIQVYAYCEDIELAGNTSQAILQSKREYESSGSISGPASTVASIASKLKAVPVVAPFATATETAAKMISGVASIFGYTNVPNVADVQPFKPIPFQLASSTISEPVMKMSVQPKQEIAVGNSYCGGDDTDLLNLKTLLERESFLCGVLWTTTNATGDTLFTTQVRPELFDYDTATLSVAHTPLSYISNLWEYWRGDIIFRLKCVRSQYHRGRLDAGYDVGAAGIAAVPPVGEPGAFHVAWDLDKTDEIEIRVPYVQAKPFLRTWFQQATAFPTTRAWENSGSVPILLSGEFNGMFTIKVMNRLTAPEATSDVDILIFVRAGENFQFAGPADIAEGWTHSPLKTATNQSSKVYTLGREGDDDDVYRQVFGEKIVSLRELLHRSSLLSYNTCTGISTPVNDAIVNYMVPFKRYPRPAGCYNNGWETVQFPPAVTNQNFNLTRMIPLNWVLPMFIGYKGSVNVTFNVVNLSAKGQAVDKMGVVRSSFGERLNSAQRKPDFWNSNTGTYSATMFRINQNGGSFDKSGAAGAALTNQKTNAGLAVNLPYYNNSLFLITDPFIQYSNADTLSGGNNDWWKFSFLAYPENTTTSALKNYMFSMYYATGPDFDVTFYLGCPMVFYTPTLVIP